MDFSIYLAVWCFFVTFFLIGECAGFVFVRHLFVIFLIIFLLLALILK